MTHVDDMVRESFADPLWALPFTDELTLRVSSGVRRRRRLRSFGVGVVVLVVTGSATGIGLLASQHPGVSSHPPVTSTGPTVPTPTPTPTISTNLRYLSDLRVGYPPPGLASEGHDGYRDGLVGPTGLDSAEGFDASGSAPVRVELRRYVDRGHATLVALTLLTPKDQRIDTTTWLVNWATSGGVASPLTGVPTGPALLVRTGSRDSSVVIRTEGGAVIVLEAAGKPLRDGELVRIARSLTWSR